MLSESYLILSRSMEESPPVMRANPLAGAGSLLLNKTETGKCVPQHDWISYRVSEAFLKALPAGFQINEKELSSDPILKFRGPA
jgi:hypothetical protein